MHEGVERYRLLKNNPEEGVLVGSDEVRCALSVL